MSIKTAKLRNASTDSDSVAKRSKSANGRTTKASAEEKSINERWIEKYGVADSKADKMFLKLWKKVYERHKSS